MCEVEAGGLLVVVVRLLLLLLLLEEVVVVVVPVTDWCLLRLVPKPNDFKRELIKSM